MDAFEREPQGYVSGKLVIAVERADGDPVSARTGAITVEFAAPLIGERIAECNHDGDQACLLLE